MEYTLKEATAEQLKKYDDLKQMLKDYGSAAVAFSSGVDSTFLLYAAKEALGDKVIAVTAKSCSFPQRELNEAKAFCESHKIRHFIFESEELDIEGFSHNPKNRCYLCKHELFEKIIKIAEDEGIAVILEGSNLDDNGDYRPGLQAVAELGIKSPLRAIGFTKDDIRVLSGNLGLPTWNKQSFACLSSRFVYGETISREKLGMVDKAEQLLLDHLKPGITGPFAAGNSKIIRDAADPTGFRPASASEFFHSVCQKILVIFPHVGIRHVLTVPIETLDFIPDLFFSHAAAHSYRVIIQAGHADSCTPGFEMMDGRHIERFEIVLNMLAGKRFSVLVAFSDG